ncbi:MAG: MGMT family protein [Defluviitaleaceae bacterium]|nr:MGMT family protein [Defluviitaleaceae bacterium]
MEKTFNQRVYDLVAQIPCGKVASYGEIARALGNPRAARQVGWAMARCPEDLPWQRVVKANGEITGYDIYASLRRQKLEEEGITFLPSGNVDMKKHGVGL